MNEAAEVAIAPIVTLVVALLRRAFPGLPGRAIVAATPVLGILLSLGMNAISSLEASPEVGAAMGALGTYLHQLGKQWKPAKRSSGSSTPEFVPDEECKVLDDLWAEHKPRFADAIQTTCVRCGKPLTRA